VTFHDSLDDAQADAGAGVLVPSGVESLEGDKYLFVIPRFDTDAIIPYGEPLRSVLLTLRGDVDDRGLVFIAEFDGVFDQILKDPRQLDVVGLDARQRIVSHLSAVLFDHPSQVVQ